MDLTITPITKREIDLHSSYRWESEFWDDLRDLESRKETLDKTEKKLYSYLNFSVMNFILKRGIN